MCLKIAKSHVWFPFLYMRSCSFLTLIPPLLSTWRFRKNKIKIKGAVVLYMNLSYLMETSRDDGSTGEMASNCRCNYLDTQPYDLKYKALKYYWSPIPQPIYQQDPLEIKQMSSFYKTQKE